MLNSKVRALLLGGLLPVILFTVIEEYAGTLWGLVAGMAFGLGEVVFEWRRNGRVEAMTWFGNGMLLVLGGISLLTQAGTWFKLQPAILEACMGLVLIGSMVTREPLLVALARKQGALDPLQKAFENHPRREIFLAEFLDRMKWLNFRMGIFFWVHAGLATWAALFASTRTWALLKGVGFTGSMIVYLVVEILVFRYRIGQIHKAKSLRNPDGSEVLY